MRSLYYNKTWARTILEQTGARTICFDHIMPQRYVVSSFLKAAGEMSIPALSLPHGVMLYTNENTKPKSTNRRRRAKFARFDYVLVPNQLRKDLLVQTGIPDDKIFVLGCARYCKEWLEQNKRILPRLIDAAQSSLEKLKVVFMQSKPQCRVDLERMSTTFNILADLPEIQVMVKPHTRSPEGMHLFDEIHLMDASRILTAELCEWADVMLVVGSSVITEALMQRKPALYLKYLHKNTTLFEDLGACWVISDEQALKKALSKLQRNRNDIPYDEQNVAEYLTEVVGGGHSNRDVLSAYQRFIVNCASDARPKNYI
jgi:UDP-N-acetylglucosamine 2-epimerase